MRILLALSIVVLFLALAGAPTATAQSGTDPGVRDTLWVDTAVSYVSGIGVVPVTFFNDETLNTIEVTLKHNSTHVQIDSFSFVDSRVDIEDANYFANINSDSTIVNIVAAFTNELLPPGNGLLGKLYYSYSNSITPQGITIDTVRWKPSSSIEHATWFKPSAAPSALFIPCFVKGYLDIQTAPETFDSVYVADVAEEAGQPIAVEVGVYNERNLAQVILALDYGSDLLQFDSVSFTGTRGVTAQLKTVQPQTSIHKLYIVLSYNDAIPLAPGTGAIATLHFTIGLAAPDGRVDIDSTTVGIGTVTRFALTSLDGNRSIYPFFHAGGVDITAVTDVGDIGTGDLLPTDFALSQNYPNPFNPTTNFELSLPTATAVRLDVFNVLGQKVRTLVDEYLPAGVHVVTFDGTNGEGAALSSGVYFYRVTTDSYAATRKMVLVK